MKKIVKNAIVASSLFFAFQAFSSELDVARFDGEYAISSREGQMTLVFCREVGLFDRCTKRFSESVPLELQCPNRLTIGRPIAYVAANKGVFASSINLGRKFDEQTVTLYNTEVSLHNRQVFRFFLGNASFLNLNRVDGEGFLEDGISRFVFGDDSKIVYQSKENSMNLLSRNQGVIEKNSLKRLPGGQIEIRLDYQSKEDVFDTPMGYSRHVKCIYNKLDQIPL